MKMSIKADTRAVMRDLRKLPKIHRAATVSALNRVAQTAASESRKELATRLSVPQKVLKKRVRYWAASPRKLKSTAWVGKAVSIKPGELGGQQAFYFKGKRAGTLTVGRRRFKGVFKATMPGGHTGLYARKEPGSRRSAGRPETSPPNLPIEKPQIRIGKEAETVLNEVVPKVHQAVFRRRFDHELRRRLKRR